MKLESKEQARSRGVPSPDRAEALMLALCKPPQKFEYYSERNPPGLQSRPNMNVAGDDDEDYRRPRGRGFWDTWAPSGGARQLRRSGF